MVLVGDALLGPGNGRTFMLIEAFTVFLALIGTTLSCMNTGARVTYAMGKDEELPDHYGALHSKNLTPHRAIWTLATISAVIGVITVAMYFGDAAAPSDDAIKALPQNIWSSFGYLTHDKMAALPIQLLNDDAGVQLRDVPAVYAELLHLHRGISRTPEVQRPEAPADSGVRITRQSGLYGVLSDRPVHGVRHQDGTFDRAGNRRGLGHLRRNLLHPIRQEEGEDDHDTRPRRCSYRLTKR